MAGSADFEPNYDFEEAIKRENINVSDFKLLRNPSIPSCPPDITDKQVLLHTYFS